LPLPSWIDKPAALEGLREWRGGTGLLNSYLAVGQQAELLPHADIIEDPTGATKWLVEYIFRPRHDSLLLVQGLALYGELATDSATTEADKDLIASGACYLALRDLNDARKAEALSEFAARSRNLPRVDRPMRGVY
jgi:hypothetical protein